jgi:tRNA (cmo5U34)-methyltransferase
VGGTDVDSASQRRDLSGDIAADRDFEFNEETASVFEDMLERSVPFYHEMQRMLVELTSDFAVDQTAVYDIGCSTGATLSALDTLAQDVTLIGIDSSPAMLARAETLLKGTLRHRSELRSAT